MRAGVGRGVSGLNWSLPAILSMGTLEPGGGSTLRRGGWPCICHMPARHWLW